MQDHVSDTLRSAVAKGRVAHAYLFAGPRGVGKTTAARVLAMALNCERRAAGAAYDGEPCGVCASCQRIWSGGASLDVVEIDAASNRGVDDARELRERAMYAPSGDDRYKVYIVDEAHMLTREAWNALLKVLEEPPPRVVFVFATTEPQKITNTAAPVMSRLQRFDFRPVGPQAIAGRLADVAEKEGLTVEPDAMDVIARVANGGMRDALSVLDQVGAFGGGPVSAERVRGVLGLVGDDTFAELCSMVARRRSAEAFPFIARLVENGVDIVTFVDGCGDLWRAALAMRLGAPPEGISAALAERICADVELFQPGDLLRILKSLTDADEPIRLGSSPRLALETLLVRWTLMDRTVEIAELLSGARGQGPGARATDPRVPKEDPRTPDPRNPAPDPGPPAPDPRTPERKPIPGPDTVERPPERAPDDPVSVASIRGQWPVVVDTIRSDRKGIVAETVADTEPVSVENGLLRIRHLGNNPMTPDSIARNKALIEAAVARVIGAPLRIEVTDRAASSAPSASAPSAVAPSLGAPSHSRRLSQEAAKSERAKALKGRDPALDTAIEAMDLELLD